MVLGHVVFVWVGQAEKQRIEREAQEKAWKEEKDARSYDKCAPPAGRALRGARGGGGELRGRGGRTPLLSTR